jgi:putative nucleotidyltransferase with HDIG domain
MAIALGLSITWTVRQLFVSESLRTARIAASAIVCDHIRASELESGTVSAGTRAALDSMVSSDMGDVGVSGVRLWNRKGVLVYSTSGEDVGGSYLRYPPVREALTGKPVTQVLNPGGEPGTLGTAGDKSLIEVYSPLFDDVARMPFGVFEIHQPYGPIVSTSNRIIAVVWAIILAGSIPAYFLQLSMVRQTASELSRAKSNLLAVNDRLSSSLDNLELHSLGTMQALVSAVDAKDSYTARHSMAVTDYALAIGRRMGLGPRSLEDLERAGLLHDVGKIGTPEAILLKTDRLTDDEFGIIKSHSEISGHIVETVPFLSHLMTVVRAHHERWDGCGYPDNLPGERIPLLARILAVADSFDAMTSERPYRAPVSVEVARAELVRCAGTQFDPAAVRAMLAALDAGEATVYVHISQRASRRRASA